ncbi:threonine/serine exporter family protein [Fundicoccus culcitae]|uniref:Threonine/serine exporter family protein n=1 Tax=Fundicoccus culcitae TaxID=2969821 RepID=A0ABY5P5K9_9LACT|nr:threonine/serine exporter family protein [Fundicoccus culcitae]UUX33856.1 threonine/serine exporter family protein [Fundicoccus culcitae]
MVVEAPRFLQYKVGIIGAVGYAVYLIILPHVGTALATFIACVIISIISQQFARIFKAPVTIFYIPSFFPLVPGVAIYRTVFNFINGDTALGSYYFFEALMIAGMIALAVFIVDSSLEIKRHLDQKKHSMH